MSDLYSEIKRRRHATVLSEVKRPLKKHAKVVDDNVGNSDKVDDEFPSLEKLMTPPTISKSRKPKVRFSRGNIVWTNYRSYNWPAIVWSVNPNGSKIVVIWLPQVLPIVENKNLEKFKYPIGVAKVFPFSAETLDKFKIPTDKMPGNMRTQFYSALAAAESIFNLKLDILKDKLPDSSLQDFPSSSSVVNVDVVRKSSAKRDDDVTDVDEDSDDVVSFAPSLEYSKETLILIEKRKAENVELLQHMQTDEAKISDGYVLLKTFCENLKETDLVKNINRADLNEELIAHVLFPEGIKFALINVRNYTDKEAEICINSPAKYTPEETADVVRPSPRRKPPITRND